jgi:hypothetical protein
MKDVFYVSLGYLFMNHVLEFKFLKIWSLNCITTKSVPICQGISLDYE